MKRFNKFKYKIKKKINKKQVIEINHTKIYLIQIMISIIIFLNSKIELNQSNKMICSQSNNNNNINFAQDDNKIKNFDLSIDYNLFKTKK